MNIPVDSTGKPLSVGDTVEIREIPVELLRGLPAVDQAAIASKVGANVEIASFDEAGNAELEFSEPGNEFRTIWIAPRCLKRH
jgi:hypothetical protein